MRPLSATEAISPAIERTRALLTPFSLRLWLKLGLVAVFAEMGGQFLFPPIGHTGRTGVHYFSGIGAGAAAHGSGFIVLMVVLGVVLFLIGLTLLYLGSRLQLVLMDLVATRTTEVAPAWRRTAPRTWRWIGLKVVCCVILFSVIGVILAVPAIYLLRTYSARNMNQPGAAAVGTIILLVLTMVFLIFAVVMAIWSLRDLVLPFVLFEDASFGDALRKAGELIRNEPGGVLFYLFMKFLVALVTGIAAELCILVAVLVAAIPTGLLSWRRGLGCIRRGRWRWRSCTSALCCWAEFSW